MELGFTCIQLSSILSLRRFVRSRAWEHGTDCSRSVSPLSFATSPFGSSATAIMIVFRCECDTAAVEPGVLPASICAQHSYARRYAVARPAAMCCCHSPAVATRMFFFFQNTLLN